MSGTQPLGSQVAIATLFLILIVSCRREVEQPSRDASHQIEHALRTLTKSDSSRVQVDFGNGNLDSESLLRAHGFQKCGAIVSDQESSLLDDIVSSGVTYVNSDFVNHPEFEIYAFVGSHGVIFIKSPIR